jgi:hypothetical protein
MTLRTVNVALSWDLLRVLCYFAKLGPHNGSTVIWLSRDFFFSYDIFSLTITIPRRSGVSRRFGRRFFFPIAFFAIIAFSLDLGSCRWGEIEVVGTGFMPATASLFSIALFQTRMHSFTINRAILWASMRH